MTQHRTVPFSEIHNFRDLGGYQTPEGRAIQWGRLYRSDVLQDMTEDDLDLFRRLNIATIVDLRSVTEVERTGRGLLATESVRFVNAPVLSGVDLESRPDESIIDDGYLAQRYLQYLDVGGDAFVQAMNEMANVDNYPLVFNCFFGKDRTGVLAALVLSCVGVERQTIVDDYALSGTRVPFILEKLRRDPVYRETIERSNPHVLAANANTMNQFLSDLDQLYGGPHAWALRSGITPQQLSTLGDILFD